MDDNWESKNVGTQSVDRAQQGTTLGYLVAEANAMNAKPVSSLRSADVYPFGDRGFDVRAKLKGLVKSLKPNPQKRVDSLFKKYQISSIKSSIMESSAFHDWTSKVMRTYKTNPEAGEVLMVSTLTAHYGDDVVTKMLHEAKEMPRTKAVAVKLQEAQLINWMTTGQTADDVFKLLKLDGKTENVFDDPAFRTWMSYVSKLNQKNPAKPIAIDVLLKNYYELDLASMIVSSKNNAQEKKNTILAHILTDLQTMLFKRWKHDDVTPNMLAGMYNYRAKFTKETPYIVTRYATFYKQID
ncbi:unnamed protein product [Phytophthora fragariaefolia]|uniref:Unnamed protein product n=1 Tax=Phytophthora fragariaefolia TaxID=1490495 RepID=A0A9W7CUM5_9STRA|nr:unnamed protein product [Phytophthora fragariaefolia]